MIKSNKDLVSALHNIINNYKTLYVMGCFGAPLVGANVSRYCTNHAYNKQASRTTIITQNGNKTPPVYGFDCVCLIKGLLWGWDGNPLKTYGGAVYSTNGVPDIGADAMIKACKNVTNDFTHIELGEAVWMPGHIGIYIGNGEVIECTPKWSGNVQVSNCWNVKTISGMNGRKWTSHGKLPYIEYDANTTIVEEAAKIGYSTLRNGSTAKSEIEILQTALNTQLKSGNIKSSHFPTRLGSGTNVTSATISDIISNGLIVDGGFGNKTETAVRAYQAYAGIGIDGAIGPIGWNSLLNPYIFKASKLGIYMNTGRKQLSAITTELGDKADGIVNCMFYDMGYTQLLYNPCRINGEEGENGWKVPVWGYGWNDDGALSFATQDTYKNYKNYISSEYLIVEGGKATSTKWSGLPDTVRGRTAIGLRADGGIAIYCGGDGTPGQCSLTKLREIMVKSGCITAIALDGGGSSQCHIKGNLKVNSSRAIRQYLYFKTSTLKNTAIQSTCPSCGGTGKISG